MNWTSDIVLPADYRVADLLAFHGRDAEGVAEQVGPHGVRKGVLIDGVAVTLEVRLDATATTPGVGAVGHRARCSIATDAALTPHAEARARAALQSILGLHIDPAPFAAMTAGDALVGPLVRNRPGLRIMQSASVFEALSWAIIGQQINLPFAIALRRTFIVRAGRQHSSGLWCYPEAADAARLDVDALTSRKFSRAKAETLLRVAQLVDSGALTLEPGGGGGDVGDMGAIAAALLAIKGIGPWTVNYALMRGYGHADCSLHGDVAVRAALHKLTGTPERPDIAATEAFLARYRPHRTMLAAHLWASLQTAPATPE